ncbi:ATP-binding protein [Phreatobacter sp.]|uniref:ATP-binding protein n=1 Tax=Phreatobacter sp. TaxID=1966341 RepID=UPI0025F39050|nr:ATP-binding protein [Phreatobacter sp.]
MGEGRSLALLGLWRRFDSLALRTTLVVLIGIGLVHIASLWTYQHSLTRELDLANEARLADQLLAIKRAVMRVPERERETVAHEMSGGPIEAHWSRTEHAVAGGPGVADWEALGRRLRELAPEIAEDGLVIGANRRVIDDPHLALISIRLPDQSWINVSLVSWNPRVPAGHGTLLSTTLMAFGAIVVSVLLVSWLTRPLTGFAAASKELYRSKAAVLVPEDGPREVRALAIAFNDMQRRIGRLIDDRTQALAAVSHDLKTPITRLRFRLEEVSDPEARAAIAADLDDMERMLDQTLAYLRGDRADEEFKAIDVAAILETIVDDASDRGHAVTLTRAEHVSVPGRRLALKRAFGNLIDNALKYGREALITVEDQSETVIVSIRDQGPGIAPEDIPRALAPFVRLEPSRNQETGGFGLGLTIAQAIVEGHGGQLTLANHVAGGLVVSVHLPKKQRPA